MNRISFQLLHLAILVSSDLQIVLGLNSNEKYPMFHQDRKSKLNLPVAFQSSFPADFGEMCGGCEKKHVLSVSACKTHARTPRRCFNNFNEFMRELWDSRHNFSKRDTKCNFHVVKCLQQDSNTVTCFGGGKFYQFQGDLTAINGEDAHDKKKLHWKRCCSTCSCRSQYHKRVFKAVNASQTPRRGSPVLKPMTSYQEVMMEPGSRKELPKSCYGFVAPQAVAAHSKKASFGRRNHTDLMKKNVNSTHTNQNSTQTKVNSTHTHENSTQTRVNSTHPKVNSTNKNMTISIQPRAGTVSPLRSTNISVMPRKKDFASIPNSSRRRRGAFLWSLLRKRSNMVTIGCRPLYVPTAKPSVNDGRIPQCRVPCYAHNCVPRSTCPCRPPCQTPAPPPTTCSPIPGWEEATKPSPSRCAPYEFTDEPCPSDFACKDGCPYLTTPGCPCPFKQDKKAPSIKEVVKPGSCDRGSGPVPKNVTNWDRNRPTETKVSHVNHTENATAPQTLNTSMEEKLTNSSTVPGNLVISAEDIASLFANATASKIHNISIVESPCKAHSPEVSGAPLGPVVKPVGSHSSSFGHKVPGVWSNFDFKKLLKSAKTHYKEKIETNLQKYLNEPLL